MKGHQVVGVKAEDVRAENVPDKPLDGATHALLAEQLVEARTVAMRYPTVADATAAGYRLVGGGFGPGSGAHYIGGGYSFNFDPNHPLALIYDGIHPTSRMVGLMYYSMGTRHRRASQARTTIGTVTAVCASVTAAMCCSRPTPT